MSHLPLHFCFTIRRNKDERREESSGQENRVLQPHPDGGARPAEHPSVQGMLRCPLTSLISAYPRRFVQALELKNKQEVAPNQKVTTARLEPALAFERFAGKVYAEGGARSASYFVLLITVVDFTSQKRQRVWRARHWFMPRAAERS